MDLSKRCANEIDERDWQKGTAYFQCGSVQKLQIRSSDLTAKVSGSERRPYDVSLNWKFSNEGTLLVDCTCPRYEDVGCCKHIAAVILAADEAEVGKLIPGKRPLLIEPFDVEDDEDNEDVGDDGEWSDEFEDDQGDWNLDSAVRSLTSNLIPGSALGEPNLAGRQTDPTRAQPKSGRQNPKQRPAWKTQLLMVRQAQQFDEHSKPTGPGRARSKPRQIWYVLDVHETNSRGLLSLWIYQRVIKQDGQPGELKPAAIESTDLAALADPEDRFLLGIATASDLDDSDSGWRYDRRPSLHSFSFPEVLIESLLPRLCATGRFGWMDSNKEIQAFSWDDGPAWSVDVDIAKNVEDNGWTVSGKLKRGAEVADLRAPLAVNPLGWIYFPDRVARFLADENFHWAETLCEHGPLTVPVEDEAEFVEELTKFSTFNVANLPPELRWDEKIGEPRFQLIIRKSKHTWERELECWLNFQYDRATIDYNSNIKSLFDRDARRVWRRNLVAEGQAVQDLLRAGATVARPTYGKSQNPFSVSFKKLSDLVFSLTEQGWTVESEGALIRRPGQIKISVTSGVDWFDLEGTFDFDGASANLPELLAALNRGERMIRLDDGSQGILPREWLARFGSLAELGTADGARLKFAPSQGALLDALLAAQATEYVSVDKQFAATRQRLRSFDGIAPRKESRSFAGELRPYQREGLGWLRFLDEFGFGGCLADDMGLGKTIQVLALLEERRAAAARARNANDQERQAPSLVVAPRSLIFNWIEEARRFAPKLRVLNYTGLGRGESFADFQNHDLIVTTYGTLRQDIAKLEQLEFDYAILDESQAIKNAASQSAKACRLLRARRRLAMTGTPVENHLDELWSLFEFLNPGMLGRNSKLSRLFGGGRKSQDVESTAGNDHNATQPAENVAILAKAIRPFLLRRTKQQVLTELPEKSEQTLYCELDAKERKRYEELRKHYQQSLLATIEEKGLQQSKIHVLEALLRLRQAACHPGLLDPKRIKDGSAKLDVLLEQLTEVVAEGHKALVFSQFTSLLAIVRQRLDLQNISYAYLDGQTTKRQQVVERFQTDAKCSVFLISLKAGGQGLNLTAADYVFILDPWWNPAVEAQAVDRAHRMGQQRHVFAYRLIAKDTVEEKILQLQDQKRNLAEAIVSADNSLLRNLTSEDLMLLLS